VLTNNKDKTIFSKQYPISCNFYSEGCDGGYPFLVGKFFHEFEIVPEECFKYTQTNGKCSNVCDYKNKYSKKYVVSEYGYIGGYYGATTEVDMMKELRARGPIPGNIRVPYTFNYYKNGIYSEGHLKSNVDSLNKTRLVDRHLSWDKVEHSITLVGYGEENGVKYWIGMNTWGTNWGENGFFKILRGENDCAIESMGDYLNIEVLTR
jgi:cathepsin C